jgi:predicted double-glycine peptidase
VGDWSNLCPLALLSTALWVSGLAAQEAGSRSSEKKTTQRAESAAKSSQMEALKKSRQSAAVPLGSSGARRFNHDFQSWQERNQHHVVMQQQDYSCGAAALATMAKYYFRDNVTEKEVLTLALKGLTAKEREDREKNGLSMDDLFNAAKEMGYQATVYDLGIKKIKELQAPIIVRTIKDDYKHFVVLRGVVEDRVWLADPIRGNVREPVQEFSKEWNGVALFLGKTDFGLPKKHPLAIPESVLTRPELRAAQQSVNRPVPASSGQSQFLK